MTKNDTEEKPKKSAGKQLYSIFHTIVALFAIFLSFKCNNGFNLPSFLAACCCPTCYIVYAFAVKKGCNIFGSKDSTESASDT
uniref:Transmembrane protein n=1 Tax=viral metagenome TaxID=1070528 RepID=A0A6C0D9I9_9ZZZZ